MTVTRPAMSELRFLGGYPVVDVAVDIVDGSFHSKDSNDLAFQIAQVMDARAMTEPGIPGK